MLTFAGLSLSTTVEAAIKAESGDLSVESRKTDLFEYKISGRQDPFVPFYNGDTVSKDTSDEVIDTNSGPLVGMQRFEPGQLTLVALMQAKGNYLAMVQDFKGQGYVLREKMKIGKYGEIKQITSAKVYIQETRTTKSGKVLTNQIVMKLRKEGDD